MPHEPVEATPPAHCDVAVIGAGLAGASIAALMVRRRPKTRVVLFEAGEALEASAAEPLSPIASLFFSRVLGAEDWLAREHLPATGTHAWFAAQHGQGLAEMAEIGWSSDGPQPCHHIDPARLARQLERRAEREGLCVLRGQRVTRVELSWPRSRLCFERGGDECDLHARWTIDATGAEALLARELGLRRFFGTPALWTAQARWSDLCEFEDSAPNEGQSPRLAPWSRSREFATHHFCGEGWQVRVSPHPSGGSSVHLLALREAWVGRNGSATPIEAYSRFVRSRPGLRELLRRARLSPASFEGGTRLDWAAKDRCGRGWWLLGEAAGASTRPFSSPIDRLVRDAVSAASTILGDVSGATPQGHTLTELGAHNQRSRARDTSEANELFAVLGPLHADAATVRIMLAIERFFEGRESSRSTRDPESLWRASRDVAWLSSLRGTWITRLKELAAVRGEAGIGCNFNSRPGRTLERARSSWAECATAAALWLRLEYGLIREGLRPVPGDDHLPAQAEIVRRAALAQERAGDFQ